MALHAMCRTRACRTGPIVEACDDLLHVGDPYSTEEKKHRARAVVRI